MFPNQPYTPLPHKNGMTSAPTTKNTSGYKARTRTFAKKKAANEGINQATRISGHYPCPNRTVGFSWKNPNHDRMTAQIAQEYVQWLWQACPN